jgi:hypothetical protein
LAGWWLAGWSLFWFIGILVLVFVAPPFVLLSLVPSLLSQFFQPIFDLLVHSLSLFVSFFRGFVCFLQVGVLVFRTVKWRSAPVAATLLGLLDPEESTRNDISERRQLFASR